MNRSEEFMKALAELMKEYKASIEVIGDNSLRGYGSITGIEIDFPTIDGKQEWDYVSIPEGSYISYEDIEKSIKKKWGKD